MYQHRIALLAATSTFLVAAPAVAEWTPPVTAWHYDADGTNHQLVLVRQLGTAADTIDDTQPVSFRTTADVQVETRSSRWVTVDLSKLIPKSAKVVLLGVKTIVSKQEEGSADVYVFARRPGSVCCQGPPGFLSQPVDFSVPGNMDHLGMIGQAVAQHAGDGVRSFSTAVIAVRDRKIQIAWGYRRMPTDGIAFDLYLNGWGA